MTRAWWPDPDEQKGDEFRWSLEAEPVAASPSAYTLPMTRAQAEAARKRERRRRRHPVGFARAQPKR